MDLEFAPDPECICKRMNCTVACKKCDLRLRPTRIFKICKTHPMALYFTDFITCPKCKGELYESDDAPEELDIQPVVAQNNNIVAQQELTQPMQAAAINEHPQVQQQPQPVVNWLIPHAGNSSGVGFIQNPNAIRAPGVVGPDILFPASSRPMSAAANLVGPPRNPIWRFMDPMSGYQTVRSPNNPIDTNNVFPRGGWGHGSGRITRP